MIARHGTLISVFQKLVYRMMARRSHRTSHLTLIAEIPQHYGKTVPACDMAMSNAMSAMLRIPRSLLPVAPSIAPSYPRTNSERHQLEDVKQINLSNDLRSANTTSP
jgi:hypothetical protein